MSKKKGKKSGCKKTLQKLALATAAVNSLLNIIQIIRELLQ
jgi:hypothetical protein